MKLKYKVGDVVIANGFEEEMVILNIIKPFWRGIDEKQGYFVGDSKKRGVGFFLCDDDIIRKSDNELARS